MDTVCTKTCMAVLAAVQKLPDASGVWHTVSVVEERLKIAVFIDYDNIEIGVK